MGSIIVFLGEGVRVWAGGHLIRNEEVTTSGPYAYLRDPLYLGRILLLIGFCIMAWGYNWIVLLIGLGVFFFNYMPRKYRKEMARLENLFGDEYKAYASYTRSLLPRLKPYPEARKRPWRFHLFWKENREQYFLLGVVAFFFLVVGRYLFS
jgi:protein-S-isoprenylcysteine O-methyltransferase Ste14